MGDVALVLAVVFFWAFVACVVAALIWYTATSRDDEEVVCDLTDGYYEKEAAPVEAVPAT